MNISGNRGSAIDARSTRHAGYMAGQRIRKRIVLRLEQRRSAVAQDEGLRETQSRVPDHAHRRDLHDAEGK